MTNDIKKQCEEKIQLKNNISSLKESTESVNFT